MTKMEKGLGLGSSGENHGVGTEKGSEGEVDEWNYTVETINGDEQHDDALRERADKVHKALNKPLPEELVRDVDNLIGKRLQEHEDESVLFSSDSSFFDREIGELSEQMAAGEGEGQIQKDEENHYINLIKDLSGHEGRRAKSLNEVWSETEQLKGAEKIKRLKAIKVFSLALNKMQPLHETEDEWVELKEGEKVLVRAAEITKLRVDIEAGNAVYESKLANEIIIDHAKELRESFDDYALGDDIPEDVRVELKEAAVRAVSVVKDKTNKIEGKQDLVKEPAVLESAKEDKGKGDDSERIGVESKPPIEHGEEKQATGSSFEHTESSIEFINRPIFEKDAIKREDLRVVEGQLRELAEKNDPRSIFGLARQLAYLKRAGVKMSDKGHDYFVGKLQEQVVAVRERGARAVAQYHVYLKYLKAETELSEEDRVIIRKGLREGVVGNKGKVASLAVNAKYLGVVKKADMMRDDLQADMKIQLEGGASADKVALEMARRKYLGMSHGLPDNQLHYQQRIDNKLEGYAQEGQWGNYAKLKSHVDYVRGDKVIEQGRREQVVGHVEERAKLARESGDWGAYTSYVADAVHLSRRHEQVEGEGEPVARRDSSVDFAVNLEVAQEELRAKEKERQRTKEKREGQKAGEERGGQKKELEQAERLRAEQFPERAKFAKKVEDHEKSQDRRGEENNKRVDVLAMSESELRSREADLLRRRESERRSESEEDKWANETMEKIRDGADFGEVLNERYMVGELKKHKVSGTKREAARQRYMEILRNDFDYAQDLENPTVMDRASSLWMESWYARVKVAGGAGKLKAIWPGGKAKRGAWRNVISARQDMVDTMKQASEDDSVDKRIRALFKRMATEYELLNVRDARALRKRESVKKETVEKTEELPETAKDTKESEEDKLRKEVKKKYKKKYKEKYQGKSKKKAGRRGKKEKAA